jgi:hypothetical protein
LFSVSQVQAATGLKADSQRPERNAAVCGSHYCNPIAVGGPLSAQMVNPPAFRRLNAVGQQCSLGSQDFAVDVDNEEVAARHISCSPPESLRVETMRA